MLVVARSYASHFDDIVNNNKLHYHWIKMNNDTCIICYNDNSGKLSCNHRVCIECVTKINRKCPYCRKMFNNYYCYKK